MLICVLDASAFPRCLCHMKILPLAHRGLELTYDEFIEVLVRLAHLARPLGDEEPLVRQLGHLLNNEAVGLVPASERVIGLWQAMEPLPKYADFDY